MYFSVFFRGASGFREDVDKAGKIPVVDRDYDYVESKYSYTKIMIWILLSVGSGVLAYYQKGKGVRKGSRKGSVPQIRQFVN